VTAASAPPPRVDRGLLRWTYVLIAVDLATWLMAWLWLDLSLVVSALAAYSALSLGAVSALYVATAYGAEVAGVLQGARWPWLRWVFWPFRGVSWFIYATARRYRREEVVCEVMPGVFLGPRLFDRESERLTARRVTVVVDVTSELPASAVYSRPPFERITLPLLDRSFPNDRDLDALVDRVLAHVAGGRGVFIHCAFGRGRSALVACAAVIKSGRAKSAEDALAQVKAARPAVRIRADGVAVLRRYAARHAGVGEGLAGG
jgi:hypothetical protein